MMNGNEALAPMRHRSHSGPAHLTSAPDAERSAKESETPGRSLSVQRYRHARCRSFGPLDTGALRIFAVYGLFFGSVMSDVCRWDGVRCLPCPGLQDILQVDSMPINDLYIRLPVFAHHIFGVGLEET
jgi:hypothetical protein